MQFWITNFDFQKFNLENMNKSLQVDLNFKSVVEPSQA